VGSLYLWGRAVDRFGAAPIFGLTGVGLAALYLALLGVEATPHALYLMIGFFFWLNVMAAGFGVADTHVMFRLAPVHAPTRHLVVADVASSLTYGVAPLLAGMALDRAVAAGATPLIAYRSLFAIAALLTLLSLIPLRHFRAGA